MIGDFADDSPWADHVALIEPLSSRKTGERSVGLTPVARNGENQWIGLLEQQARDLKAAQ